MDFDGTTGHVSLVRGTNDRANMPIQIVNSHGYKDNGTTVDFVSVGRVDPATGELILNEDSIVWPGNVTTPPKQ